MPDNPAAGPTGAATAAAPATAAPDFPLDSRTLVVGSAEFAAGGRKNLRLVLHNPHDGAVLHVRFAGGDGAPPAWVNVSPSEVALGPEERQNVVVGVDIDRAKDALRAGAPPVAAIPVSYQRLFPTGGRDGAPAAAPAAPGSGSVYLRLPLATCPTCDRVVDDDTSDGIPEVCPYCFERLRACPVCGAPNSWLARQCVLDPAHVVRSSPDWGMLGGGPDHSGAREGKTHALLSRRWSYPSVAPARRENALLWSAPAAAYGLVAASASTHEGETHVYAFDAVNGAPLWEPYPLQDPVYPERGGVAVAGGRIFSATVEGVCTCLDALRGTRVWETSLPGRVYGAVIPVIPVEGRLLLVPGATSESDGCLFVVGAEDGRLVRQAPLPGPPDSAPAYADGVAFVHDDSGALSAVDVSTGELRWRRDCGGGFDAAPVVRDGMVFSATSAGMALCHDAATGEEKWRLQVTSAPFSGTPACDGALLYLPADDGMHLISASAGRAVRRYGVRRPVRSAPAVLGGTLFFGGTDGNIYGVEAGRTLENLYQTGLAGSQVVAAPAIADGALFVTATNGVLYALTLGKAGTDGR